MAQPRILLTGGEGMLGTELRRLAASRFEVVSTDVHDMDVADRDLVFERTREVAPDFVVHAGAWTDVDGCERDPDRAYRVNALGTRNVAEAAREAGAPILYVSTDYVFDGTKTEPYLEFDEAAPRSAYGRSKWAGERFVRELAGGRFWIVRTQWVFGLNGRNFVDTILRAAREGRPLRVVDDQFGCPTWARDLARALLVLLEGKAGFGTYHASSRGACSWFELARAALDAEGLAEVPVEPMSSDELDRPAPRPARSVLRNWMFEQTVGDPMPDWRTALAGYLEARRAEDASAETTP